jgi:lysophospholipase L1-like esterase
VRIGWQYPDFPGHAGNANRRDCPHCYRDDNRAWLFDGTHPNEAGNQHIADKWKLAIDRMYTGTCQ